MPDTARLESLFVRLYLDQHIKLQLADDLRGRGFNVLTTQEAELETATDEAQLEYATRQDCTLVTYNIRDFAPLHEEWTADGRIHAGIIVSQQLGGREYGLLLSRMLRLLDYFSADEMRGNFVHLEQFR